MCRHASGADAAINTPLFCWLCLRTADMPAAVSRGHQHAIVLLAVLACRLTCLRLLRARIVLCAACLLALPGMTLQPVWGLNQTYNLAAIDAPSAWRVICVVHAHVCMCLLCVFLLCEQEAWRVGWTGACCNRGEGVQAAAAGLYGQLRSTPFVDSLC